MSAELQPPAYCPAQSDACCLDLLRTLAKCASGLQRVELRGCVASAGVVYALQPMTALQRLELNAGHRETDIELRCFEALPGLQELAVSPPPSFPRSERILHCLPLLFLQLLYCRQFVSLCYLKCLHACKINKVAIAVAV